MPYGQDSRIGISFQNSFGTLNTASMHWLEPISESVDLKKAQLQQKGLRAVYDAGDVQEGINTVEGDITIEAKANALGVFLSAVCAPPTTVTSGSLYTHTFKPRQADHSAVSAERPFTYHKYLGDVGSAQIYSDLNGNSLELSISNGELLTAKLGVVGGTHSRMAALSATYSASNPIDWSVSSVSIGGTGLVNIRAMTITQENQLSPKHVLDSDRFPARIKRGDKRAVNISGTMIFDSQSEYDYFLSQTDQAVRVNLRGTSMVQSGYYESLLIDIPTMRYTEMPVPVGAAGELEVSFKGIAKYNIGSGTSIAYTLACGKAGF